LRLIHSEWDVLAPLLSGISALRARKIGEAREIGRDHGVLVGGEFDDTRPPHGGWFGHAMPAATTGYALAGKPDMQLDPVTSAKTCSAAALARNARKDQKQAEAETGHQAGAKMARRDSQGRTISISSFVVGTRGISVAAVSAHCVESSFRF